MERLTPVTRYLVLSGAIALAFFCGAVSRGSAPVHAAASELPYQFTEATPSSALTLYSPEEHAIYVYQGVNAGNSHVNCSYRLMVRRPGGPVDRQNCPPGSLLP